MGLHSLLVRHGSLLIHFRSSYKILHLSELHPENLIESTKTGTKIRIVVYSPQIWENYQLQSGEGLSVAFVVVWLLGDLCNFVGALLDFGGWHAYNS